MKYIKMFIFGLCFLILSSLVITFISNDFNYNRISIFGYKFNFVISDSMEPTLNIGDFVITKITSPENVKHGDIITYIHNVNGTNKIIIHRVVKILDDGFVTKGDNRSDNDNWIVKKENVISKTVFN